MRNRNGFAKFVRDLKEPHLVASRENIRAKRNRANRSSLSRKRFDATEDLRYVRSARADRSTTEVVHPIDSEGNLPTKTEIVTALPSYIRQRLSDIRRGWCLSRTPKISGFERVVRSDASEAHRLSLSARFLSARDGQVKAKQQQMKHFCGSLHAAHQVRRQPPARLQAYVSHLEGGPELGI